MQAVKKLSIHVFNKSSAIFPYRDPDAFAVKWRMLITWICSRKNWDLILKSEQREALELLLRGKDVFCVLPTGFGKSLIYKMFVHAKSSSSSRTKADSHCYLACVKTGIGRQHTTFTSCQNAACSNELFPVSGRLCFGAKRFDWANVNFGRLLNIFHTERSWHTYWFSLVGMICPLMQEHFLFSSLYKCKFPSLPLIKGFRLFNFSKVPPGRIWIILSRNPSLMGSCSKRFSLCPSTGWWMWLFPARFCHAGPSSLAFLAGCLNSHG